MPLGADYLIDEVYVCGMLIMTSHSIPPQIAVNFHLYLSSFEFMLFFLFVSRQSFSFFVDIDLSITEYTKLDSFIYEMSKNDGRSLFPTSII